MNRCEIHHAVIISSMIDDSSTIYLSLIAELVPLDQTLPLGRITKLKGHVAFDKVASLSLSEPLAVASKWQLRTDHP